jgi:hypothetical protein
MSDETQNINNEQEDFKAKLEKEAEMFANAEAAKVEKVEEKKEEPKEAVTSLGKAQRFQEKDAFDEDSIAGDIGWKNVPIEYLPSQGIFYTPGTQVAIRAATAAEIRHWSTIDENDLLGVDDMLNFIIEKCCRIKVPGKPGTYKDLREIDRFYLIFAIRDYTFKNGENKMYVNVSMDDGHNEQVEVTKDIIDYFTPNEKLMEFYNREEMCFHINMKNGESFKLYLPTLGSMGFIKNYIKQKQQQNANFDKAFIKYAPFLFNDWKTITQAAYDKAVQDSYGWSVQKISVMDKIVELLSSSINPQIRYNTGAGEGTAPLNFQGGVKSLFLISDIFGELV